MVRATWYAHAVVNDWGDIGYHYLIDRFGAIYQGRYGGDDVVGGHAKPYNYGSVAVSVIGNFEPDAGGGYISSAAQASLSKVITWLAYRRDMHPYGSSFLYDRTVSNIIGHHDVNPTACPGANLYPLIPTFRQQAWATFPDYGTGFWTDTMPAGMQLGQTVTVNLAVTNRGRVSWAAEAANPVTGYHWYRSDGSQYVQDSAEDHRTSLPGDLGYGQQATLPALLTAPRGRPGPASLKWDMVEEGRAWFNWRGCPTYDFTVTVAGAPPQASLVLNLARLDFWATPGVHPAARSISIGVQGASTLHWAATADQPWCRLSVHQGDAPGTLDVSVNPGGLPGGQAYDATVTVSAAGTLNWPQQIQVHLRYDAQANRLYVPALKK